jgi:hypothetical protein
VGAQVPSHSGSMELKQYIWHLSDTFTFHTTSIPFICPCKTPVSPLWVYLYLASNVLVILDYRH